MKPTSKHNRMEAFGWPGIEAQCDSALRGIDIRQPLGQSQREGAESFVKSWKDLLDRS